MIKEIVSVIFVLGAIDWITSSEGEYVFHSGDSKKPEFACVDFVPVNSISTPKLGNELYVYITNQTGKKLKSAEVECKLLNQNGATIKTVKSTIDDERIMPGESFRATFSTSQDLTPINYDYIKVTKVKYTY